MHDVLVRSLDWLLGMPWLEILKAAAPVATALIAFSALRNWKRQDRAKRHADFLDQLIETVHDYVSLLAKPVEVAEFVKIGIKSHEPAFMGGDQRIAGVIQYIQKRGKEDSHTLVEALNACRPAAVRLRALMAKGQVFRFRDYHTCKNAVNQLTWQLGRLESLALLIGSTTLNWENPEVLQFLEKMIAIEPEEIRKQVDEENVVILAFTSKTYETIYGR
jgi:hypothetical protein